MKPAWLALCGALLVLPVAAEPTTPVQARSAVRSSQPRKAPEILPLAEPIVLLPTSQTASMVMPRAEAAPVPNREIEAPVRAFSMQAQLLPDIFRSRMPGRTANTDGVINQREERVYTPAAGARLVLPFFTR